MNVMESLQKAKDKYEELLYEASFLGERDKVELFSEIDEIISEYVSSES